ncbi:MAG: sporulation protein YqfC [Firmicutes bacterium]|jgi:sporulation protein YqfC|nr:sporulation protein YqfC [Bacillota bacterium]MCL5971795.1 sporulation protein YqfC [Bacillota bacterium]
MSKGRTLGHIAEVLGLPPEVLVNVPRIEVVGRLQLRLENHLGMEKYQPHRIVIRVSGGYLLIMGEQLAVGWIDHNEILVTGQIQSLSFQEGRA